VRPFLSESSVDEANRLGLYILELPMDITSPVRAFLSLKAAGHQACLLESADGPDALARYSFIGVNPHGTLHLFESRAVLQFGSDDEKSFDDPVAAIRAAVKACGTHGTKEGLPPFAGGWVGYLNYDFVRALEPRVPRHPGTDENTSCGTLQYFGDIVAFDHARQRIFVITDGRDLSEASVEEARSRGVQLAFDVYGPPAIPEALKQDEEAATSLFEADQYEDAVRSFQQNIGQGEIFQGVPSRRFTKKVEGDSFTLYRALRLQNPAPHMFYYETPECILVGSSPERLVSITGTRIETRPIAGTRKRGKDSREDESLGQELIRDQKERAEHDMLVDLARNDLGRVARVGTVQLMRYASLEKFSRVQHLVSVVEADLRSDCDAVDALCSCFPAGTVTGAPKIRAMELIAEVEPEGRGPYAGAFGYFDRRGNMDMAITIRTMVVRDGEVQVQAGAGVVYHSNAKNEEEEVRHKASALLEALNLASSTVFGPPGKRPE
jgi:anthranilate synthase component 1